MAPEPTEELLRIAASYSPKIRNALLQSYRYFLETVPESRIIRTLDSRGLPGLLNLADVLGGSIAENVTPLLTDAWQSSGRRVSGLLPKGALTAPFSFDTARVATLSASEGYRARFVVDITESQRQALNSLFERSFMEGWSKSRLARSIRESIGLTSKQSAWVENYRRQLTQMDPELFNRLLRDRRSDKLIARLMESGQFLDTKQINNLVERYRQRLVKYRAETIARTESIRAVNMGEYESLVAARNAGSISSGLRRFWETSKDEKVRRYHIPIPNMNVEGREIDEPFSTPLGALLYPLDPNGSAANVINCRCRLVYRMPDSAGGYRDIPTSGKLPSDLSSVLEDLGDF